MRYCFQFAALALVATIPAAADAAAAERVRYVVKVDKRTGRLVRTAVVQRPRLEAPAGTNESPAPTPPAIAAIVEETAKRYEVDPHLVHSVISVESAYNPAARSYKGAQGLMQLMPGTARRFGVANAWDVRQNIEGGVRYLRYLSELFPNDLNLTLAAYNAGEGAVWKYGNMVPPYRETLDYVRKVGRRYERRKAADPAKPAPPPALVAAVKADEPQYRPIRSYVDAEGRLHISTDIQTP